MKKIPAPILIFVSLIIFGIVFVIGSTIFFHQTPSVASSGSALDIGIARAQAQIAAHPPLTKPYITLASLYLQKVRETSDSSYYAKIDALMDTAALIDPTDGDVPAIRASAAMGRHDFVAGYAYITKALALNDTRAAYWGLKGDADIELGRYDEAVASFQKMVDMRPDFSSWSRIAYIRELYGDIPGAKTALNQAITSGSNYPENIAWAYVELGKIDLRTDPHLALTDFTHALTVLPTYSQAIEGEGKAEYALGDAVQAQKLFMQAYTMLPLAQYAVDIGDLAQIQGSTSTSQQYYALAQVAFNTSRSSGVDTDLEESLFLSDHDLDLSKALQYATQAHTARPSMYGADYLAWALYKNGKTAEAATYVKEAFRLGQNDALILYHQGMIAQSVGDTSNANSYFKKAYALNPNFSVQYAVMLKNIVQKK
jgi:tetratricopeptide (TPR) repeat protein